MNLDFGYETMSIFLSSILQKFEIMTTVEVLEHIRPEYPDKVVERVTDLLVANGQFVFSVSQGNKPVQDKHNRHLFLADLESILRPPFESICLYPLGARSKIFAAVELVLGGRGQHVVVSSPPIVDGLRRRYKRRSLYADGGQPVGEL